ncbi:hypothetical protein LTR37_013646 [Vermiconidia calcicola]|uniref:Uncharacterized protein n=1 Tax=Vermiconidia calcicola TaxID=1690605 RepID=A0ACC3MYS1_9PEZI|nr:hypothetical protein LTR37_013646 [Vermiconidia calcicola]
MAVVVEQTLPFSSESLDLENGSRWNNLFPLIRPSIKTVQTSKGQTILVDEALAKSKFLRIAAVGTLGNFSSKLLDEQNVTAIVTERAGAGLLSTQDIPHAMYSAGIGQEQGVVVVRAGKERRVEVHGSDCIEVETDGELEQDHVLHLLGHSTESCRTSIHQTAEMLKSFAKGASTSRALLNREKLDGKPSLLHAEDAFGFEKAKHAVEKVLAHSMKHLAHKAQTEQVVYSVHYSDINGLSRLENYIIAGEIAQYLESQNIPYQLSHSTILDHQELARGWSVSICPVPAHYLAAQAQPKPHVKSAQEEDAAVKEASAPLGSRITFSDAEARKRIEAGCNALIKEEPTITGYDAIVGDGDCGYTLRDGAKQVLQFIEGKDLDQLPETLATLVNDLEVNMGGTSGALYCIYLTALATALSTESTVAEALSAALEQLYIYTNARLGDRTMMDALIPYIDTLVSSGDAKEALAKAKEGVEGTKKMEATLGRSAYLDESATQGVPDPGAYGLYVLLEGMSAGS